MPALDQLRSFSPSIPLSARWGLMGVVLGVLLLAGCSSFSSEEKPLPDSTFSHLLTELHLATIRANMDSTNTSGLRDSIFAHYDVQRSEFDATLRYYTHHPKAFGTLYQSIIDTLQALQFPEQSGAAPKGVPDSISTDNRGGNQPP